MLAPAEPNPSSARMFIRSSAIALCLLVILSSGCTATDPLVTQKIAANQRAIEKLTDRTHTQLNALENDQAQLNQRLLKTDSENATLRQQVATLNDQIKDLHKMVQQLETARGTDRKQVIDTISQRMTELMKKQAAQISQNNTSPGPQFGSIHVVRPGETLSEIGAAYNVSVGKLIKFNKLARPDNLKVGQEIIIPE
jgi:LysM repeat protein